MSYGEPFAKFMERTQKERDVYSRQEPEFLQSLNNPTSNFIYPSDKASVRKPLTIKGATAKRELFVFFCHLMHDWYRSELSTNTNDLSVLKTMKLLFFVAAVKKSDGTDLLDIFDDFRAMPHGPVEMTIYPQIRHINATSSILINQGSMCIVKTRPSIDDQLKSKITASVDVLKSKNSKIVTYSAADLVDISRLWEAWRKSFYLAIINHKNIWPMDKKLIRDSKPIFRKN